MFLTFKQKTIRPRNTTDKNIVLIDRSFLPSGRKESCKRALKQKEIMDFLPIAKFVSSMINKDFCLTVQSETDDYFIEMTSENEYNVFCAAKPSFSTDTSGLIDFLEGTQNILCVFVSDFSIPDHQVILYEKKK